MKNRLNWFLLTIKDIPRLYSEVINNNVKMRTTLVLTIFFFLYGAFSIEVTSQSDEVVKQNKRVNEPIELISIKTKKKQISLGQPFAKSEDWYKGLQFEIKNTSEKNISYISIELIFRRPEGITPSRSDLSTLPFGVVLPFGEKNVSLVEDKFSLQIIPDQTYVLQMTEPSYFTLKDNLKKLGYPTGFKGVEVEIREIGFSDRTFWTRGIWYKPDPQNPN
jgi:hypothetical protein